MSEDKDAVGIAAAEAREEIKRLGAEATRIRNALVETGLRSALDLDYLVLAMLARIDKKLGRLLGDQQ